MFNRLNKRLETLYPIPTSFRRAKALAWSLIAFAVGFILYFLSLFLTNPGARENEPLRELGLQFGSAAVVIIILASMASLLRGRLTLSSRTLGFGLFLITLLAFMIPIGVIYAAVTSVVLLNIVLASLYLPRRDLQILTILYAISILVVGAMQVMGVSFVPAGVGWEVFQDGFSLLLTALITGFILSNLIEQLISATEKAEASTQEMVNLVTALEQQTDRLSVINEISQMSSDVMPFESLGQMIADKLMPILSPDHVSIGFLEMNKQNAGFTTFFGPEMPARLSIVKTPFAFALDENRTVRLNYRDHQRGTRFLYQVQGIKFMLIVPLAVRDQLYGTLNIGFTEPDMIIADDVVLCEQVARQIAVMIENMQLYGRLDNSMDEQSALYNTSLAINAASDLPTIYQMALKELANISGGDRIDLFLSGPDPHNIVSHVSHVSHWQEGEVLTPVNPDRYDFLEHPFLNPFANLRTNLILEGSEIGEKIEADFNRLFLFPEATSLMILPLSTGPIWLGFVVVQGYQNQHFSSIQIRLCRGIVDQVALAIDSQVLLAQARNAARREQIVNKLSYQMERANSMDEIIRIALTEIRETVGSESITLRLGTPVKEDERMGGGRNNG